MWIFAKTGFVSIVEHNQLPQLLLVRARVRMDLVNFVRHCPDSKRAIKRIKKKPDHDYAYRVSLDRRFVVTAISELVASINYTNFKEEVHEGSIRDDVYMGVWSETRRLDPNLRRREQKQEAWDFGLESFDVDPL